MMLMMMVMHNGNRKLQRQHYYTIDMPRIESVKQSLHKIPVLRNVVAAVALTVTEE